MSWLLIQIVETTFPAFGLGQDAVRIVITVALALFVPTLILAWVFELTPEGIKRERDVDRSQSITPQTGKKLDRVIIVVLVVALGYFAIDKFVFDPQRDAQRVDEARQTAVVKAIETLDAALPERSIVVLPFVDLSAGGDQEYFSDGIAEELLNLLARIPELRVISRSSAFSFKGKDVDSPTIARQLRVAHILEGSVRGMGEQMRINVQLIDARTDTQLWSKAFDRAMEDPFAIQDEIAARVVEELKIGLLGDLPKARVTDPNAFALFLRGHHLNNKSTPENATQAEELLRQALAIDPKYAAAWSSLFRTLVNQSAYGLRTRDEAYRMAREAAERALASDPDHVPTHARLGWLELHFRQDLETSAAHISRALELDPSDPVAGTVASQLAGYLGRSAESTILAEHVADRDPVNALSIYYLGNRYLYTGRYEEAMSLFEDVVRLSPGFVGIQYRIGLVWLLNGEPERAISAFEAESSEPHRLIGLALALPGIGRNESADEALASLIEKFQDRVAYNVAYIHAYNGRADDAFESLQLAAEKKSDGGLNQVIYDPLFANLHDDPRWHPYLVSIGRSPEQLAKIDFRLPASLQ
jgi:TolB-like protein/cytochrome c-type biogenesis protein CcmH/NrfG